MKILIIQSFGEHDGSSRGSICKKDKFQECFALKDAFEAIHWETEIWGLGIENHFIIPEFNNYDVLLVIDNDSIFIPSWLPDFRMIKNPIKIQWITNLHYRQNKYYYNLSKDMDIILHSTKFLMENFKKLVMNKKHIWFPYGFNSEYFENKELEKKNDLLFVGQLGNKKHILHKMVKMYGMKYSKEVEKRDILINEAKVIFNKSDSVNVDKIIMETVGCGTCLLTNYLPELEELGFKDGENCYMYKKLEEIPYKLRDMFTNDKWKEVAKKGHLLSVHHTYINRVKYLVKQLRFK